MKKEIKIFLYSLTLVFLFANCASTTTSTIVGGGYNESKNVTDYMVFPYGSVSIPGKWTKTSYNSISRQQFFENKDSISIAIAFCRYDKYEFNAQGQHKGFEFVEAYYEWDTKYFIETYGLQRQEIERDSVNGFMTYRIFGQIDESLIDTYFLISEKNGNITNLSILATKKWSESDKLSFLKGLINQEIDLNNFQH